MGRARAERIPDVADAIANAEPVGPRLAPVDLSTLMAQDWPAQRTVLDPILPRRVVTLLGGHGGVGKTMLGLTLAAHVACGRKWGPFDAVQAPVVFVSLEDEAAVVRYRLRRIIDAYELPVADVLSGLRVFDGSGSDATLAVEVMAEGVRTLQPTVGLDLVGGACEGAGLVVIDNASDAYGGNENDRRQVRGFIRMLAKLARSNDAAVLLLAHIDKSAARFGANGNTYSGSTAWHNSVRSRLALVKEDHAILLVHEKANFSTLAEPVPLAFVGHGVLWPQDVHAREADASRQAEVDAAAVLTVLGIALASGATITTAKRGSATAWHALCDYPELADEYKAKGGQQRVNAALVRLERDGSIAKVSYRDHHRNARERYELTQIASDSASENARSLPPIPPCVTNARTPCALVPQSALVSTDAKLTQRGDWLANADPEIKARLAAMRTEGPQ